MAELGRPEIIITFKTRSASAITRSGRGIGAMILNDEKVVDELKSYTITESSEIPTGELTEKNVDLIKKALLGVPERLMVYAIPLRTRTIETTREQEVEDIDTSETTIETITTTTVVESTIKQADALKKASTLKFNYICHPTGNTQDQEELAIWIKAQRRIKHRTVKGIVANVDADSYGVINLTTGNIRVVNSDYTDALIAAEGIAEAVPESIPQYIKYTAAEYTARILGIACGISLDRSMTYYELSEVVDCDTYDDVDEHINNGELCLIDEGDGNGVKIARGCNSLRTFTSDVGEDFRKIKIVEAIDLITDDIRETFRSEYLGKVINDYNHKMLFVAAIMIYFENLKGNVLNNAATATNRVDIDYEANENYAKLKGQDVTEMSEQAIREFPTGSNVFLSGEIQPVDAMEDLKINFVL